MKRYLTFFAGLVIGGILFGAIGMFLGYLITGMGEPVLVVRNVTQESIPRIAINTDIGESYSFESLPPRESRRTKISGRDKSLWITATSGSGKVLTSEKIYVTSRGTVFGAVSDDSIAIDYEL